ncbi:hypothetical protein ACOBQJ_09160 [Pelotomaculum propionicicum]
MARAGDKDRETARPKDRSKARGGSKAREDVKTPGKILFAHNISSLLVP